MPAAWPEKDEPILVEGFGPGHGASFLNHWCLFWFERLGRAGLDLLANGSYCAAFDYWKYPVLDGALWICWKK